MGSQFIVGYNGTVGGRDALALALALADAAPGQHVAITVAAITPLEQYARSARVGTLPYEEAPTEEAVAHLDEARDTCRGRDGVTFVVRAGRSPAHGLHLLGEELGADLIVVGRSHAGPLGRAFLGSATEQTLHGADCPVAVSPVGYADTPHRIATVVVAYTGSDESENALTFAIRVARDRGAKLRLVRALEPMSMIYGGIVEPYPAATRRADIIASLDAAAARVVGLDVEASIIDGDAVHALSHLEGSADLLVVGSRDFGPVGRILLGGVSARLSRHCPTPLLVVPRLVDPAHALTHETPTGAGVASAS